MEKNRDVIVISIVIIKCMQPAWILRKYFNTDFKVLLPCEDEYIR